MDNIEYIQIQEKKFFDRFCIKDIRVEIEKEKIINLDFTYLQPLIDKWWLNRNQNISLHMLKLQLISLILQNINDKDIEYFDKVGINSIAGICITNIFSIDNYELSLVVHEAFSDLFHIRDIKYDYEEHKALYLKPTGEHYSNWGNGYGEITPHSDDLYEDISTDYLSLTTCRDVTKTPTILYFPKDILKNFNEEELEHLFNMKIRFISGKNVQVLKAKERNFLEYSAKYGFNFFMDFRVDNDTGQRMLPIIDQDKSLLEKLKESIKYCPNISFIPNTGMFIVVANYKVLHARARMNIDQNLATNIALYADFSNTPRLLYRSKGPRLESYL
jgi:hypothetical protein